MPFNEIEAFVDALFEHHCRRQDGSAGDRRSAREEIAARNDTRLCPKILPTQRAVQRFVCLAEECP